MIASEAGEEVETAILAGMGDMPPWLEEPAGMYEQKEVVQESAAYPIPRTKTRAEQTADWIKRNYEQLMEDGYKPKDLLEVTDSILPEYAVRDRFLDWIHGNRKQFVTDRLDIDELIKILES